MWGFRRPLNTPLCHQHKAAILYLLVPSANTENQTEAEIKAWGSHLRNPSNYRFSTVCLKKMQFCSLIPEHFIASSYSLITDGAKPAQLVQPDNIKQSQPWSGEQWHVL